MTTNIKFFGFQFLTTFIILLTITGCKKDEIVDRSLNGKAVSEIFNLFGNSKYDRTFILTEPSAQEYQYSLVNIFKEQLSRHEKIEIRELGWGDEYYTFVVWFVQRGNNWVAIDNLRWSKNIQY